MYGKYDRKKTVNRLKELRAERQYTLTDLTRNLLVRTGVCMTEGALCRHENNKLGKSHILKVSHALALADLYGVSLEYLLGISDERN